MKLALLNLFIIFATVSGRCYQNRHCYCVNRNVRCHSLIQLPDFPVSFSNTVEILDLKGCMFTSFSQITALVNWSGLKIVDIRNQKGYFDCVGYRSFPIRLLSDCDRFSSPDTTEWEMTSEMTNETTALPPFKPTIPIVPPRSPTANATTPITTTEKAWKRNSTKRIFPRMKSTKRPRTSPHPTMISHKNATDPIVAVTKYPLTPKKDIYMHLFFIFIGITIVFIVLITLWLLITYVYGGICTCLKRLKAAACSCIFCKRRRKDNDSDHDSTGDDISLTSLTVFDLAEITKPDRKVDRKADTLRPRCHDKMLL